MTIPIRRRRPAFTVRSIESLEGRLLLARAGAIDTSFGNQGSVNIPLPAPGGAEEVPLSFSAVEADGTIVLAGSYNQSNNEGVFVIEELNANGTPKTSFGQGGQATFPVGTTEYGVATAMVVRPDGTIDLAGTFNFATSATTDDAAYGVIQVTPGGKLRCSSFMRSRMACTTLSTSAPCSTAMPQPAMGLPSTLSSRP